MALCSIFQEAFTAPSSARDIGQEMLHATLLLSCAFVGWCASSALVSAFGWMQKYPNGPKAKEGSSIFREEVAAYVQANNVEAAAEHFGLSCAEISNCIDAVERSEGKTAWWQWLLDAVVEMTIQQKVHALSESTEASTMELEQDELEEWNDDCGYSIAPAVTPGMALLEQYGVFGASSGTWSGPVDVELENDMPAKMVEVSVEEEPSHHCDNGYDLHGRVWVPLEYTW